MVEHAPDLISKRPGKSEGFNDAQKRLPHRYDLRTGKLWQEHPYHKHLQEVPRMKMKYVKVTRVGPQIMSKHDDVPKNPDFGMVVSAGGEAHIFQGRFSAFVGGNCSRRVKDARDSFVYV